MFPLPCSCFSATHTPLHNYTASPLHNYTTKQLHNCTNTQLHNYTIQSAPLHARQCHGNSTIPPHIESTHLHKSTALNSTTEQSKMFICAFLYPAKQHLTAPQLHNNTALDFTTLLNVMWWVVILHRWTVLRCTKIKLSHCTALLLAMYVTLAATAARLLFPLLNFDSGELTSGGYCELSPVPPVQHQEKLHNYTTAQLHNYTPELWLWWTHFGWILSPVPPVPPPVPYKCFHRKSLSNKTIFLIGTNC